MSQAVVKRKHESFYFTQICGDPPRTSSAIRYISHLSQRSPTAHTENPNEQCVVEEWQSAKRALIPSRPNQTGFTEGRFYGLWPTDAHDLPSWEDQRKWRSRKTITVITLASRNFAMTLLNIYISWWISCGWISLMVRKSAKKMMLMLMHRRGAPTC